ncbi:hypothetical protein HMPREF0972_00359 [Actinomyces sp. oral taxon 848 str. F0332]|nr:hypothetical protein HMPREF0972_00359 [Actinomyces sp. oral taxon 848 str. F0332]
MTGGGGQKGRQPMTGGGGQKGRRLMAGGARQQGEAVGDERPPAIAL